MTLEQHLPVLQVLVPLLSAPLVVMLRPRGLAWAATAAAVTFSFLVSVNLASQVLAGAVPGYVVGDWQAPVGITLKVDAVAAILLLVVNGAGVVATLAGRTSIDSQIETARQPLFYSAWLLAIAGLSGMVVSGDAFNIFVFMEISSLAAYVLIAGGPDRRALPAVFKYLIMGTIGATFYLIGVGLLYMMTGTLNLEDLSQRVVEVSDQRPVLVAAGFITIGLGLKAALFPIHVWLPNAYAHAPHMVTVLLAACGTKVAVYVLLRLEFEVFRSDINNLVHLSLFLMPLALLGIIVSSAVAMFEGHIKRMLAFSSVAQIGYILLGVSLLSDAGLTAAIIHIFNHALAKGALFLAVACLAMRFADLRIDALAGAAKTMPVTCFAFVLGGLSLIGVPGTAGFISKWLLIDALMDLEGAGLIMVALVVLSSLMAVAYVWRVVETLYFREPVSETVEAGEAPWQLLAMTLIVVLLNIWFGLSPDIPLSLSEAAAVVLLGGAP